MLRLALTILWTAIAAAQSVYLDPATIESSARSELAATNTPGAVLGIVENGKLIYAKAFGLANVETGAPLTVDCLFRLGSTTKMMTAAAVATLVSEGKASFSDPVGKYISGLDPAIARLTVNQILSHTSGLQDAAVMNGRHDDAALGEEIRAWKADWLFTQPGKIYSYSNPGFWLAGFLAETIDHKPYADVMQERVFGPLGMVNSTLRPTMAMTRTISQGHDVVEKKLKVLRPAPDNSANWPAGSVFSNLADLARLTTALMDRGKLDGQQVLPNAVIFAMTSPHADIPGSKTKYGYGLDIEGNGDGLQWNHAGSRAGYGSYIGMIPANHTAMIVLCNRTSENLPKLRSAVMAMLGKPQTGIGEVEPTPIPKSEFSRYVGHYRNGENRKEIVEREGKLFLGTAEIWRASGGALILKAQNGTPAARIVVVPGPDGSADYLFQGGRSLARIN